MRPHMQLTILSTLLAVLANGRVCPDKESECPDTSTCCLLSNDEYGCCPFEDAVCCDDHTNCCPSRTKCDTATGRCLGRHGTSVHMKRKQEARKLARDEVICPDKRSKCPSETTCCDLGQGRFGCCPIPNAVCCSDHLHCCPEATSCDPSHGRCLSEETDATIPWYKKFKATKIVHKTSVKYEMASTLCEDGNKCLGSGTCCESEENDFSACCSMRNAVCCYRGRHCCPHGYECDEEEGRCTRDDELTSITLTWSKTAPTLEEEEGDAVLCHDGSTCPSRNKCCPSTDDDGYIKYSCCPLSQGVCCEETCCPSGYSCAEGGKCEKKAIAKVFVDLFI